MAFSFLLFFLLAKGQHPCCHPFCLRGSEFVYFFALQIALSIETSRRPPVCGCYDAPAAITSVTLPSCGALGVSALVAGAPMLGRWAVFPF